jgi:hypothetical protein
VTDLGDASSTDVLAARRCTIGEWSRKSRRGVGSEGATATAVMADATHTSERGRAIGVNDTASAAAAIASSSNVVDVVTCFVPRRDCRLSGSSTPSTAPSSGRCRQRGAPMLMHMAARDETKVGACEQVHESPVVVGRNVTVIDVRLTGMHIEGRLVHEERERPACEPSTPPRRRIPTAPPRLPFHFRRVHVQADQLPRSWVLARATPSIAQRPNMIIPYLL